MSTDRELLELAAKAAEMGGAWEEAWQEYVCPTNKSCEAQFWRPLTDDGDALRLVVKLKTLGVWKPEVTKSVNCEGWSTDPYAATRRAIVCAAAEIGKKS